MSDLATIQREKSLMEDEINTKLDEFREKWPALALEVETVAIHRLGRQDSRVRLTARVIDPYKWDLDP